ncbi:MAG TPA: toll/interleukin-1 receptor domain-containing protein, partial [Pyrinomonadaceae bacterium]
DEVSSTVYAPTEAPPGDSFLVQVFLHLPEQATDLEELAREADDAARARITSKLKKTIKRGTELKFHLTMPGLEIDEPSQSCVWEGEPVCAQFGVTIPQDRKPGNIIATVIVSEASIPIGHLKFKFKIAGSASQDAAVPANQPVAAGNLTRYKQAFISYASPDRAEVLKRVQMLNLVKVKFFQDLLTLEPGDNWEQLLYKYIDESDVFYLFWSQAASKSEWVKKEIVYALKRKAGNEESAPEIVPVIIEGPPAVKPPEDLAFLQFNDKFMYFIQAEEHDN